jgi:hypothetical protein
MQTENTKFSLILFTSFGDVTYERTDRCHFPLQIVRLFYVKGKKTYETNRTERHQNVLQEPPYVPSAVAKATHCVAVYRSYADRTFLLPKVCTCVARVTLHD